jgi:type III secretory pathway component EscU
MSAHKRMRKGKTEGRSRLESLFKTRGTRIVSLVIFVISALYSSYQTTKVMAAMNVWTDLKAADPYSDAVEEALRSLNNEETTLITPFGLTLLSFAAAFHSIELKMIPKKCFYCRKWAQGKNVKQTPDRAFYYHEECETKKRKQSEDH